MYNIHIDNIYVLYITSFCFFRTSWRKRVWTAFVKYNQRSYGG